jgi:ribose transport system substrate-binding protein
MRLLRIIFVGLILFNISSPVVGKCIAVVTAGGGQNFWNSVIEGANQAGRELSIKIYARGAVDENNEEGQRKIINAAIKSGCTGLVLAPNSENQREIVDRLKTQGIPTVFIDRDIHSESISVIKTENFTAGKKAALEMAKALDRKGKIVVLRTNKNVKTTTARENGFIQEATAQGLEIIIDQYIGTRIGEERKNAYKILKNAEHVDGIFTPNEASTMAVIKVIEQLNKPHKIIHIGFDAPKLVIDALKSNHIYGFMVQDPFQIGYLGIYTVNDALLGKVVEKKVNTEAVFINQENINTVEIQKLLR